jgi:hypothetical protein
MDSANPYLPPRIIEENSHSHWSRSRIDTVMRASLWGMLAALIDAFAAWLNAFSFADHPTALSVCLVLSVICLVIAAVCNLLLLAISAYCCIRYGTGVLLLIASLPLPILSWLLFAA